ncbi:MAG: hypothetical protein E7446_03175 [Ruminococcaceae bacterium]|nr:hypothetical protein [Oscillospiraceae bacterium]
MTMSCDFDRIDALLAGTLPEDERAQMLAHMKSCSACRAYYEVMSGLEGAETAPAGFTQRVMEQVRITPQSKVRRTSYRKILSAVAACAVLVITLQLLPLLGIGTANDGADGAAPKFSEPEMQRSGEMFHDDASDIASDLPLFVYTISDETQCAQVRGYLNQHGFSPLYGTDAPREAYDLMAEDVRALNREFPELALPEQMLQLELKSAK